MRVLALDYGLARCGCAISDPTGTLVRPLPVVEGCDSKAVAALVADHAVELVLVGLPLTLSGERGPQAERTLTFVEELRARLEVPVETHDERFTTLLAQRSQRAGALAAEDSLAAAHLLEGWLERRG